MSDGDKSPEFKELDSRLQAAQARPTPQEPSRKDAASGLGAAFRIAVDLVAGVAVGVAIGLLLDRWLGTAPWLLIVFFLLGSAAGIRNVFKTAQRLEEAARKARAAEQMSVKERE